MSGLKASVLAAVKAAELATSDLKVLVKHVSRGAAVNVPGSTPTYPETLTDVSMVWTRFTSKEVDGDRIMSSDWRGLVFYTTGLPDFKTNDLIRVPETVEDMVSGDYRIIVDDKVMVGSRVALHQLQLRFLK